jgi:hypothetical protein
MRKYECINKWVNQMMDEEKKRMIPNWGGTRGRMKKIKNEK